MHHQVCVCVYVYVCMCVCVFNFQEDRSDVATSPPKLVDVYLVGAQLNGPWLKPGRVGLSRLDSVRGIITLLQTLGFVF